METVGCVVSGFPRLSLEVLRAGEVRLRGRASNTSGLNLKAFCQRWQSPLSYPSGGNVGHGAGSIICELLKGEPYSLWP